MHKQLELGCTRSRPPAACEDRRTNPHLRFFSSLSHHRGLRLRTCSYTWLLFDRKSRTIALTASIPDRSFHPIVPGSRLRRRFSLSRCVEEGGAITAAPSAIMDQEKLKRMQQAAQSVRIGKISFFISPECYSAAVLLPKNAPALPRCTLLTF